MIDVSAYLDILLVFASCCAAFFIFGAVPFALVYGAVLLLYGSVLLLSSVISWLAGGVARLVRSYRRRIARRQVQQNLARRQAQVFRRGRELSPGWERSR